MILTLILAIENEDDRALILNIYLEMFPVLKKKAYKYLKDNNLAEDIAQDTIVRLIDKIDILRDMNKPQIASYAVRTTVNLSINYYNRHFKDGGKIFLSGFMDDIFDEQAAVSDSKLYELIETQEQLHQLGGIIKELPDRDRNLLCYRFYYNLPDKQIGNLLDIPSNHVRVYIDRIKKRIQKKLRETAELSDY